jgi:hypothetical protein
MYMCLQMYSDSYSGSPLRRVIAAAVALKPVMLDGCSRLQFPNRAYLMHVGLFKFRSNCSASLSARSLAVLMSCILGSLLLLFFLFLSDRSLCIPSSNFHTMDLLVDFCGLGVPPPLFPPPPPPPLSACSGWIPRTYLIKCNEMDRRWKILIFMTHLFNARKASLSSKVRSFFLKD